MHKICVVVISFIILASHKFMLCGSQNVTINSVNQNNKKSFSAFSTTITYNDNGDNNEHDDGRNNKQQEKF